jgi:hypothetical protein
MYQFTGSIKNEFRPEPGVNLVIKGLGDKIIQQPQHGIYIDHKQDEQTLTLTLSCSEGGTADRSVKIEITGGTEKTTTSPDNWKVELTCSDKSTPCKADIDVVRNDY